jgi:hypothetical protein
LAAIGLEEQAFLLRRSPNDKNVKRVFDRSPPLRTEPWFRDILKVHFSEL